MYPRAGTRRRGVVLGGVSVCAMVVLVGCGGGPGGSANGGESSGPVSESVAAQSASQASDSPEGRWSGTWQSNGDESDAALSIVTADPFLATIDVPGQCGATWKEKSREGSRIVVTAQVTYGGCTDGDWSVEIGDGSVAATDIADPGTRATFDRR